MLNVLSSETTQSQIRHRAEVINAASNRYRITVQVANRAKRRRYEDFDNMDDPMMKPVLRAIIEMSDELTQPEIIGGRDVDATSENYEHTKAITELGSHSP